MTNFIKDFQNWNIKIKEEETTLENYIYEPNEKLLNNIKIQFSKEAKEVFEAWKELFKYYHSKYDANQDASLYEIREYFQGRNEKTARMNSKSDDEIYTKFIWDLREKIKNLWNKISEKIYEYGFLK